MFDDIPPTTEPPQSASATEPPVSMPAESPTDPNAIVPCAQLIPTNELNNLLVNAPTPLVENAYPGGTSCEWKYTANGAAQESLFYIQDEITTRGEKV